MAIPYPLLKIVVIPGGDNCMLFSGRPYLSHTSDHQQNLKVLIDTKSRGEPPRQTRSFFVVPWFFWIPEVIFILDLWKSISEALEKEEIFHKLCSLGLWQNFLPFAKKIETTKVVDFGFFWHPNRSANRQSKKSHHFPSEEISQWGQWFLKTTTTRPFFFSKIKPERPWINKCVYIIPSFLVALNNKKKQETAVPLLRQNLSGMDWTSPSRGRGLCESRSGLRTELRWSIGSKGLWCMKHPKHICWHYHDYDFIQGIWWYSLRIYIYTHMRFICSI